MEPEESRKLKESSTVSESGWLGTTPTFRKGIVETKSNYGDPPEISIASPRLKELKLEYKSWEGVELLTDVLWLVAAGEEFLTCYTFLRNVFYSYIDKLGYVYFGEIGDGPKKVAITLLRSSRGPEQVQNVVKNAVNVLKPKAVFSVGCCAGLQKEQAQLGDVVISATLLTCGNKRIIDDKSQWDDRRLDVSPKIGRLMNSAVDEWQPPLKEPEARDVKVHRNAEILSGAEFVNSPNEYEQLLRQFPEAIAIEPEGREFYLAAFDCQVDWVVIKGISHYANGGEPETDEWRRFSIVMAASVVNNILKEPDVLKDWPHYGGMKTTQTYSAEADKDYETVRSKGEDEKVLDDEIHKSKDKQEREKATQKQIAEHEVNVAKDGTKMTEFSESSDTKMSTLSEMFLPQHDMQDAVSKTLSLGVKKNNRISLLLIGQDSVGKTSLKKSLLGEAIDENEASTVGIDFDVVEVKEENKSQPWKLAEDSQFIASEVYAESVVGKHVAKELAENQNITERESDDGNETGSTIGRNQPAPRGQNIAEARNSVGENEINDKDDKDLPKIAGNANDFRSDYSERKSIPSSSQKIPADSFNTDAFKRKVQKEMENVGNYSDVNMDTIRFMVGDVAGQSVYYDAHSIMLRPRTLFLLVVDLSRPLTDQAHSKFVEKGTKIEQDLPNLLKETNFNYVTRWMAAVRNLKSCSEESSPKTILVLTKPDELSGSEKEKQKHIEEVIDTLEKKFKLIKCETIGTFVIRNKEPRNNNEEQELKELREKIFKEAQNLLKDQEKTPISWLMLERALDIRRKEEDLEGRPYITLDEARRLDEEFSMVDKTFEEAMEFLHNENIVVHISEDPDLKNLVVLDAKWLVELFTNVLTVPKVRSCGSEISQAWKTLRDKGELQFDKLPNPLDDHNEKEALKLMMVNAGLICHKQGDTYLVPSMVTKRKEENEICECLKSCLQPSLFLDFKEETIPLAFYTRFQVELLKAVDQDEIELYCNFMSIHKKESDVEYIVIVVRHASSIECAVKEWKKEKTVEVAKSVLSLLNDTVKKIQTSRQSFKGLRYEFCLECDICSQDAEKKCLINFEDAKERFRECPNSKGEHRPSKLCEKVWIEAYGESRVDANTNAKSSSVSAQCTEKVLPSEDINEEGAPSHEKRALAEDDVSSNRSHSGNNLNSTDKNVVEKYKKNKGTNASTSANENASTSSGIVETKHNYGDPPQISIAISRLEDLNPKYKSWGSVELLTDVLLLVVTDEELLSCYTFLRNVFKSCIDELGPVYFGEIGDGPKKVTICLVRSSRGPDQVQIVVKNAVNVLKPKAVFSVGCCAGFQKEQAQLGDVVISATLLTYGNKRIIDDKSQWDGRRLDVSPKIGRLMKSAADGWRPPLKDPEARDVKVLCNAEVLSGAEFVNSPNECKQLLCQFPEITANEPEGQGVYSAAYDCQIEWVVIKGISHYADVGEPVTKEWRQFSSVMAASVVNHILKESDVLKNWPHYQNKYSDRWRHWWIIVIALFVLMAAYLVNVFFH